MGEKAIRVAGLGKEYQLGTRERGYTTFREAVGRAVTAPFRRLRQLSGATESSTSFWALKDVSFDVEPGEVVGIIGRNGAGKSTLLKILSQITEPTTGEIALNGRVASLLEVGTGFHPELSGRENIYLNGAILGMSRAEIKRKFDEIVAFAEVEKFLDTPVKRYSSGMYVRLAFAVAAHLEPEILIVDEVLAVGDTAFQKKCLGKMGEVAKGGRTVLFVSHNMGAIQTLCTRGVFLSRGQLVTTGPTEQVVTTYLQTASATPADLALTTADRSGSGAVRLTGFWLEDGGRRTEEVASGRPVSLVLRYSADDGASLTGVSFGVSFHTAMGDTLSVIYSDYTGVTFGELGGEGEVRFRVPELPLNQGLYYIGARVLVRGIEADWPKQYVGQMNVVQGKYRDLGFNQHSGTGPLLLHGTWTSRTAQAESPRGTAS